MKNKIIMWLLTAFLVPPVLWLFSGLYLSVWTGEEMLRIILSPYIWIYIFIFIVTVFFLIRKELLLIEAYQKHEYSDLERVQLAIFKVPVIFFIVMAIYCSVGPNAALLGQSFLSGTEYLIAEFLAIPIILLFTTPFFILMIASLEELSANVPLPEKKELRFLSLDTKMIIAFILNMAGSLMVLIIGAISLKTLGVASLFILKLSFLGLFIFSITVLNLLMLIRQITGPVRSLTGKLSEQFLNFSMGKGRLSLDLHVAVRDEIGYLVHGVRQFFSLFRELVEQIENNVNTSSDGSRNLSQKTAEARLVLENIMSHSMNIEKEFGSFFVEIKSFAGLSEEMGRFVGEAIAQIKEQSGAISQSAEQFNKMSESLENLNKDNENKITIAHQLEESALAGEKKMRQSLNVINELADSTNTITEMVEVINNVADQTNMLAMNAAIEAAHAGTAGQGFSIVAQEIRELAEATASNADKIGRSLTAVTDHIGESRTLTESSVEIFQSILESITAVATGMIVIQFGLQDISKENRGMIDSLNTLTESAKSMGVSSDVMGQKMEEIQTGFGKIEEISQGTRQHLSDISLSIQSLYGIFDKVSEQSEIQHCKMTEMHDLVKGFDTGDNDNLS